MALLDCSQSPIFSWDRRCARDYTFIDGLIWLFSVEWQIFVQAFFLILLVSCGKFNRRGQGVVLKGDKRRKTYGERKSQCRRRELSGWKAYYSSHKVVSTILLRNVWMLAHFLHGWVKLAIVCETVKLCLCVKKDLLVINQSFQIIPRWMTFIIESQL